MILVPRFLTGLTSLSFFTQAPKQDIFEQSPSHKSVAIVGAGSAGLAILQTFLTLSDTVKNEWDITLFEEREDVGGVWLPDDNVSPPNFPQTPLYPRLHTNTPVPSMAYPGFPFSAGTPLYPTHPHIKAYHEQFAKRHKLFDYIRFNYSVDVASWVGSSEKGFWNLSVTDGNGLVSFKEFGHLVVASGNHHIPHIPTWKGQDEWLQTDDTTKPRRRIVHSIYYREPAEFSCQNVLIIGYGSSARDIATQILNLTGKTYISTRHPLDHNPVLGGPIKGVKYKPDVSHFSSEGIAFTDGSIVDVDTVILATGYLQRKLFLERGGVLRADPSARNDILSQGGLTTNFKYIFPLYQHVLSLSKDHPTNALAFIGLPTFIANCPSDIAQSLFVSYAITQPHILPSRKELLKRLAAYENDVRTHGLDPYTNGHRMLSREASYNYQDGLVKFLQDQGVYSGKGPYVEKWRRDIFDYQYLKPGWARIEELGEANEWTKDAKTEDDWSEVMYKVNEWQRKWEEENKAPFETKSG